MFPTAPQITAIETALRADLVRFAPELVVSSGVVLLLLSRLVKVLDRTHLGWAAGTILGAALVVACLPGLSPEARPVSYFGGMLVADAFGAFARVLILAAALLTVLLTLLTGIPDRDDSGDFYALLLGGTLGMLLMTQANHLLMMFVAVEMASLPSYALSGFLKGRRRGSEAALKYVVYGAGASGVMLYGISLLAGTFGTGALPDIAAGLAARIGAGTATDPVLLAGGAFLLVGLGFKLAAVPFHFWCPDVFEGAPAEVAGFLSVASKTAAVVLTTRLLTATLPLGTPLTEMGLAVGVIGAVSVTFGNLAAFGQRNVKRLLAYSTIAHAGTMLLGVAVLTTQATAAVLYYLAAYLVMNLGAFAVVAVVRNRTGSEELAAFRGLVSRSPLLAVTMTLFLFSLLGFPPLAGFAGKFQVFAAIYDAGRAAVAAGRADIGTAFYTLLAVGAVNTAVSAYYYLRIVRAMVLDEDESPGTTSPGLSGGVSLYLAALAALLLALGVVWNPLTTAADHAAASLVRTR